MALYSRHSLSMFFTKLPLTERTTLFTIDNHSDKQVTVTTHFTNPNTGEEVGEYSYIVFCKGAYLCSDGCPVLTSPWKTVGHWVTYRLNDGVTEITLPGVSYTKARRILNRRTSWWGRVINTLAGL